VGGASRLEHVISACTSTPKFPSMGQTCTMVEKPESSDDESTITIDEDRDIEKVDVPSSAFCGVCTTARSVAGGEDAEFTVPNKAGKSNVSPLLLSKMRRGPSFAAGQDTKDNPAYNTPFPALIYVPSCRVICFVVLCGVVITLCLTVFQEWFEDRGVSRGKFIEYVSIPFVSVIFTYVHIWAALYLTFYPIKYRGYAQIPNTNAGCGWQGIIPNRAGEMARTSVDLMTKSLIKVEDITLRIDIQEVMRLLEPTLAENVTQVMDETLVKMDPRFWNSLPRGIREKVKQRARRDAPLSVKRMVSKLTNNITKYFDVKAMVEKAFTEEPELLNHMFITCGFEELAFIRDCGAYMGFAFGVLQVALWLVYSAGWMLPTFGFVVGTLSNWLALKMIFEPVNPTRCCCCTIQGRFLTRQEQVSEIYARIVADNVLCARNIMGAIVSDRSPLINELICMVQKEMDTAVTDFLGAGQQAVRLFRSNEYIKECKLKLAEGVMKQMPMACEHLESYVGNSMSLEKELKEKMRGLHPEEFEGLLHPVFQQDEWKLVLMGGVLGVFVGCMQWYTLGA